MSQATVRQAASPMARFETGKIVRTAVLIIVAFIFVFPYFWMVSSSLKTLREVTATPPSLFPVVPQWENYVIAFTKAPLVKYGGNTLIICVCVIVGALSLASFASYALVFLNFRGKELVFLMLLAPQLITGVVLLLPLFSVMNSLKLLNTYWALIIPYTVMYQPFIVALLRGYLETIPRELVEAARIDGGSELWIALRVIIPLAKPILATGALFCFIWSWTEFLFALIFIQKPELRTITVGLALLQSVPNFPPQTNVIMAGAAAVTLPTLILFVFAQRQFIQGLTAGAVK
ncbi:MAG: carbohydrate ABC transporter permease [Anaerolineae bacterium]